MIYLNEPLVSSVLKFEIDTSTVALTEIPGPGGTGHWYPGSGTSQLPSPHGLATDLNGSLYIAASGSNSQIRKFDCAGNLELASTSTINDPGSHTNMFSIGNTLYTNNSGQLAAFDLCTGTKIGNACLNQMNSFQWGISYNPDTELVYVSGQGGWNTQALWVFTRADLENSVANGSCINQFIPSGTSSTINVGNNFIPDGYSDVMGITGDNNGNIYIAVHANGNSKILKYDSNGGYLGETTSNSRIYAVQGLIWSEYTNRLYVASYTDDPNYDCIAVYDAATLAYLGTGAPNPNSATTNNTAKTLAIIKECCPTNTNQVIDKIFCEGMIGDSLFLQELVSCEGIICEGAWEEDSGNTGMTYNDCNQSIKFTSATACGTFTLESDGTGSNLQCGAFTITLNIEVLSAPAASISSDATICAGESATITSTLTSSDSPSYQWQSSSTSCTTGFSDIASAANTTYIANPTVDTYYRLITCNTGTCASGNCADTTNCVTITVSDAPTIIASATDSNCDIGENNGTITLSGFTTEKYDMNIGSSYIGTADYATATVIPSTGIIVSNLANPNGSQDYTIRIFNSDDCYVDRTVTINEVSCCPPDICLPIQVAIQRGTNE